ncbi:hypothetical protein [Ralstonia solanacearum]|uniref:hypothetical protein n=1 Tax=Ralstonia solanacearum TaxID=305 RepID=UPI000A108E9A|nr:hypothetical protein [Ralstonia solanacearum]
MLKESAGLPGFFYCTNWVLLMGGTTRIDKACMDKSGWSDKSLLRENAHPMHLDFLTVHRPAAGRDVIPYVQAQVDSEYDCLIFKPGAVFEVWIPSLLLKTVTPNTFYNVSL